MFTRNFLAVTLLFYCVLFESINPALGHVFKQATKVDHSLLKKHQNLNTKKYKRFGFNPQSFFKAPAAVVNQPAVNQPIATSSQSESNNQPSQSSNQLPVATEQSSKKPTDSSNQPVSDGIPPGTDCSKVLAAGKLQMQQGPLVPGISCETSCTPMAKIYDNICRTIPEKDPVSCCIVILNQPIPCCSGDAQSVVVAGNAQVANF